MTQDRRQRRAELLEKVRKVLAIARDNGGNENEKAAALEHANRLMAAYGIEQAEVDLEEIEQGMMEMGQEEVTPDWKDRGDKKVYRTMPKWAGMLAVGVAQFTDTVVVQQTVAKGEVLVFRGEVSDVEFAKWIFRTVALSVRLEQRASRWTSRRDSIDFLNAAASKLQSRMKELARQRDAIYQKAKQESGSRAVMVVDKKMALVQATFGQQKTSRCGFRKTTGASVAGMEAGNRINIPMGRPIGNNGADRRLIGQ